MEQLTVCVTGASRGIGAELVKVFIDHGHHVLAVSRSAEEFSLAGADESRLQRVTADITTEAGVERVAEAIKKSGTVNVIINNAGALLYKPFEKISKAELESVYNVNVFAPFTLIQSALPYMHNCHVINISSVGGMENTLKFSGLSAYSTSKAALNCLTQMLAEELKDSSHSFNCLALGSVQTEMFQEAFPGVEATSTPVEMAKYIYSFAIEAPKVQNGKIISVSRSNP
jgi:NAD(P)-dependent dehydrogenase (short-subunit alcohol dehydrogenase family)